MSCNGDYDDDNCDSGVAAWVIVLIVVLVLKVLFWTIVCYRYHRRRQMFAPRVTVATMCTASSVPVGRGQVAYSGPLAGQVPLHGAAPVYPSAGGGNYSVPPPYNPGNYKLPPSTSASSPPAYEEGSADTYNPNSRLLP